MEIIGISLLIIAMVLTIVSVWIIVSNHLRWTRTKRRLLGL